MCCATGSRNFLSSSRSSGAATAATISARTCIIIRQIRSLLYEQGFTIGGARNKLTGDEARTDTTQSQQIVRQLRVELEEVLRILRR